MPAVSHALDRIAVRFDDDNAVADAGAAAGRHAGAAAGA